tara:strand:+ start:2884 stop:3873 length:990 start_codon:yes stop_codon:yes gene_type:complete
MARLSNPVPQILDSNGNPSGGAKVYFFEVGTTTPKNTYSDAGLSIANANPVVTDSAGRLPSTFLDGNYKVVAKDADGVTLWTRDPVGETSTGQMSLWVNDQVYNIPEIVRGSNDSYYRSLIDNNQGNDPISDAVNWERLRFGRVWNASITYAATDSVYFTDGNLYLSLLSTNLNQNPTTETTYWKPVGNQSLALIGFLDEDDLASDSAVAVPSQQSVKAYVDAEVSTASETIAWVNFDGTGTVSIRDSLNVSSITDNGVGLYVVNFAATLANANFSHVLGFGRTRTVSSNRDFAFIGSPTTSSVSIISVNNAGAALDAANVSVSIQGSR